MSKEDLNPGLTEATRLIFSDKNFFTPCRQSWMGAEMIRGPRSFVAYFWFTGFSDLSLGVHVSLSRPNLEIHVPFGFFRIGWTYWLYQYAARPGYERAFGWTEDGFTFPRKGHP